MSLSSQVFLGALRLQAQQRADLENNPSVSIPEWNQYLSQSAKELYDILLSSYGEEYQFALPYQFNLTQSQFYPFPDGSSNFLVNGQPAAAFYKLLGVDLQYSGSPTGWVTLQRYQFIDRNKYAYPNTTVNMNGYTNLKYRPLGDNLSFVPIPCAGQLVQIWYAPKPRGLTYFPVCSTTASSQTVGVSDNVDIVVGMSIYGPGIPPNTTVTAITPLSNQITISQNATLTQPVVCLQFWIDSATFDGISGWEEYVIIDAAIKAGLKQEQDVQGLLLQKAEMKTRVTEMAVGRDIGQAEHVSDAMALQGDGCGLDGGWFGGQGGGY
jgi:hypothetical protein